ncbi:MAG: DUF4432 family protein [Eubacteriales bacterium]|nr:DUF4432 family protein [Eubacteriales bacterium]
MEHHSTIRLNKKFFEENEKKLLENGGLHVSAFLYDTGVHALRIRNLRGDIIMLPYQGQQIWDCAFDNRRLTMKSMFEKPFDTRTYGETYGCFLLHCGATAMGAPSKDDTHPLHGELPNAKYQSAYIDSGCDEKGRYVGVGGEYEHIIAFRHHYVASPYIRLYENDAVISVTMSITNLKHTDMELMYMLHINYLPVDNSNLIYSAKSDSENIFTHVSIPSHAAAAGDTERFLEFANKVARNPEIHNKLTKEQLFDPEICFTIKYLSDENGYAYSLQQHPDGYADYVRHRPEELPFVIRWIARTPDLDVMGLALPATAEHLGYTDAREKGNLVIMKPFEKKEFHGEAGLLRPEEANKVAAVIREILA